LLGVLLYVLKSSYDPRGIPVLLADADAALAEMDEALAEHVSPKSDRVRILLQRGQDLLDKFQKEAQRQSTRDEYRSLWDASSSGEDHLFKDNLRGMRDFLQSVRTDAAELSQTVGMLKPSSESLSELSGPRSSRVLGELRADHTRRPPPLPAENTAYLGRSLFTDYLLAVELGGTLLLVATVGAIAIASRRHGAGAGRSNP
jgi:hypothetical protein